MKLSNTPEAPSGTADLIASRSPPGRASSVQEVAERSQTKKTQEASNNKNRHHKTQHTTKPTNILAKKIKKERKQKETEGRKEGRAEGRKERKKQTNNI